MTQTEWLELIRTIAAVIATFSIVIAARQFSLQRKIWASQHERSRREKAIEIVRVFTTSFDSESRATNILIERLDDQQLSDLDNGRAFDANESLLNHLQAALADQVLSSEHGRVHLTAPQSYRLRYQALNFLNSVEMVCQAWLLDVGHRGLIESEIKFLYNPLPPDRTTLQANYRHSFGGKEYFPAIHAFTTYIDKMPVISQKPDSLAPAAKPFN